MRGTGGREGVRSRRRGRGDRTGPFLAPRTSLGLRLRNVLLSRRSILDWMLREGKKVSSTIALPDYRELEVPGVYT